MKARLQLPILRLFNNQDEPAGLLVAAGLLLLLTGILGCLCTCRTEPGRCTLPRFLLFVFWPTFTVLLLAISALALSRGDPFELVRKLDGDGNGGGGDNGGGGGMPPPTLLPPPPSFPPARSEGAPQAPPPLPSLPSLAPQPLPLSPPSFPPPRAPGKIGQLVSLTTGGSAVIVFFLAIMLLVQCCMCWCASRNQRAPPKPSAAAALALATSGSAAQLSAAPTRPARRASIVELALAKSSKALVDGETSL